MAESQNGWYLVNAADLDHGVFPGTDIVPVPGVLKGDVATVLHYVGSEFNKKVERLYSPGCWGWNKPTFVPGSTIFSNHCSGTAIDLNAPDHPWLKKGTFTPPQRQEIRKILAFCEGVISWGGDWQNATDEMHFEIDATEEEVRRIATKIRNSNKPGVEMVTQNGINVLYRLRLQRDPEPGALKNYKNLTFDQADAAIQKSPEYKALIERAKSRNIDLAQFAPAPIRTIVGKVPLKDFDNLKVQVADLQNKLAEAKKG